MARIKSYANPPKIFHNFKDKVECLIYCIPYVVYRMTVHAVTRLVMDDGAKSRRQFLNVR